MTFFYEIGYSGWEECPIRVICHDSQFTTEEFDEMVIDCYVDQSKTSEDAHKHWVENSPNMINLSEDEKKWHRYTPRAGDLYTKVVGMMLTKYGFYEPKITSSFIVSDTENIVPENDPANDVDFRETYCEKLIKLRHRFNVVEPRDNKINDILLGD